MTKINKISAILASVAFVGLFSYGIYYVFVAEPDQSTKQSIETSINVATVDLAKYSCGPKDTPTTPSCAQKALTKSLGLNHEFDRTFDVGYLRAEQACIEKRRARTFGNDYETNELVNNPFAPSRGVITSADDPICRP